MADTPTRRQEVRGRPENQAREGRQPLQPSEARGAAQKGSHRQVAAAPKRHASWRTVRGLSRPKGGESPPSARESARGCAEAACPSGPRRTREYQKVRVGTAQVRRSDEPAGSRREETDRDCARRQSDEPAGCNHPETSGTRGNRGYPRRSSPGHSKLGREAVAGKGAKAPSRCRDTAAVRLPEGYAQRREYPEKPGPR